MGLSAFLALHKRHGRPRRIEGRDVTEAAETAVIALKCPCGVLYVYDEACPHPGQKRWEGETDAAR